MQCAFACAIIALERCVCSGRTRKAIIGNALELASRVSHDSGGLTFSSTCIEDNHNNRDKTRAITGTARLSSMARVTLL